MKHAILGVGSIGGLIAVALSSVGEDVTPLLRPEKLASFPKQLTLEQPDRTITAGVHAAVSQLDEVFDVLWIATKTYQLQSTFASLKVTPRMIVPLLNGIDHMAILRSHFDPKIVVAGAIAVEADRLSDSRFAQRNQVRLSVASAAEPVLATVLDKLHSQLGFICQFVANEQTLLWTKLSFLAPFALVTAASGKNKGEIFADAEWKAALFNVIGEASAVANADGAQVDHEKIEVILAGTVPTMRSSMAKDLVAGRQLELDAIGGPIVRGGEKHGIPVPTTTRLMEMIREKAAKKK
jgi:2-dehydropantoate 2-reductase